ncbi:LysE family translocator [Tropicimonas isoalkanivorans]|uniref:Threonine/homoserine/homoserine lactone efflux protein n=1 Tax=Tropicimonas isoalkanivorans TaxID=441112 RepID=A0A1I1M085_9RHOB|nr:LysE family translocator [Tropicimonas isoalkanivorans]SFC78152.1 Threonine/homoserine/homoserine lactone efflux protein [Tropicimonas isoalkanivorans]
MSPDAFITLVPLATVAAWTPGPNNALVASSGATFGLRRTWPHVLGIGLGFPLMIFLVGFFFGGLFQTYPILREGLRWIGAAILLWLAWKIATSGGTSSAGGTPRPFTFWEAAAFQWINPKGWAFAVALTSQFVSPDAPLLSALAVSSVFLIVGLGSATTWAVLGQAITRWVNTEHRLRWFNMAMGAIIAGCVVLLFLD